MEWARDGNSEGSGVRQRRSNEKQSEMKQALARSFAAIFSLVSSTFLFILLSFFWSIRAGASNIIPKRSKVEGGQACVYMLRMWYYMNGPGCDSALESRAACIDGKLTLIWSRASWLFGDGIDSLNIFGFTFHFPLFSSDRPVYE